MILLICSTSNLLCLQKQTHPEVPQIGQSNRVQAQKPAEPQGTVAQLSTHAFESSELQQIHFEFGAQIGQALAVYSPGLHSFKSQQPRVDFNEIETFEILGNWTLEVQLEQFFNEFYFI